MSQFKLRVPASLGLLAFTLAWSQGSFADWRLNSAESNLHYVTSKAAAVSEINTFGDLSGSITENGSASLIISLASVDTAIDIRNERMRDIVFQVSTYPLARISLEADGRLLQSLIPGETVRRPYQVKIDLHGQSQEVTAEIVVTRLAGGGLQAVLAKPLLINAALFGLAEGVEQLREIAGLPSINNNVVVDFTLQYDVVD